MNPFFLKGYTYLLDLCSGFMLIIGIFNGQDLALLLGAIGSITAIINHGSQWWTRTGRDWWYETKNKFIKNKNKPS